MIDLIPTAPLHDLDQLLASLALVAPLFDTIPGVVFFVKDAQARYALVNQTLVQRCGFKEKSQIVGLTAEEVFPARFGPLYGGARRGLSHERKHNVTYFDPERTLVVLALSRTCSYR